MKDPNDELTSEEVMEMAQHLGDLAFAAAFFTDMEKKLGLSYEEKMQFRNLSFWAEEEMGKMTILEDSIEYEGEEL